MIMQIVLLSQRSDKVLKISFKNRFYKNNLQLRIKLQQLHVIFILFLLSKTKKSKWSKDEPCFNYNTNLLKCP